MVNMLMKWKKILASFTLLALFCCMSVKAFAADLPLIVDNASLLSDGEITDLENRLNQVSDQYGMDVAIFTESNGDISSAMEAADDYFDYNGFGRGSDGSGLVLYLNMETRDWWISTKGQAIRVFTDYGISYIGDEIVSDLSDGDYYDAFNTYVDLCGKFLEQAQNGKPYDVDNKVKDPFPFIFTLFGSLFTGFIIGGVYICILKGQLKSVSPNDSARDYIVGGSMKVTTAREVLMYKHVSKTRRTESSSSSSSGGSSTHTSSSGSTHGGGGGKF